MPSASCFFPSQLLEESSTCSLHLLTPSFSPQSPTLFSLRTNLTRDLLFPNNRVFTSPLFRPLCGRWDYHPLFPESLPSPGLGGDVFVGLSSLSWLFLLKLVFRVLFFDLLLKRGCLRFLLGRKLHVFPSFHLLPLSWFLAHLCLQPGSSFRAVLCTIR